MHTSNKLQDLYLLFWISRLRRTAVLTKKVTLSIPVTVCNVLSQLPSTGHDEQQADILSTSAQNKKVLIALSASTDMQSCRGGASQTLKRKGENSGSRIVGNGVRAPSVPNVEQHQSALPHSLLLHLFCSGNEWENTENCFTKFLNIKTASVQFIARYIGTGVMTYITY